MARTVRGAPQRSATSLPSLLGKLGSRSCVLDYLGTTWRIVYSDWIEDDAGNQERVAFLFDRRAVTHNGLAAEIDAPRTKKTKKAREYLATQSFGAPRTWKLDEGHTASHIERQANKKEITTAPPKP